MRLKSGSLAVKKGKWKWSGKGQRINLDLGGLCLFLTSPMLLMMMNSTFQHTCTFQHTVAYIAVLGFRRGKDVW